MKKVFIALFVISFLFVYLSTDSFSKTKECPRKCGPKCCKIQEACMVDDPCNGDPACTSVLGFECVPSKLFTNLLIAVGEMNLLVKDLRKASKFARPITSEIKFLLKEITKALNFHEEACKEKGIDAVVKLNAVISKLQSKQCREVEFRSVGQTKCIPGDVIEEFLPKLQFSYEKISAHFQTDDNANLIPDLCEQVALPSVTPTPLVKITSPAFNNGENIPVQFTCDSKNVSPALRFESVPENAKSLAFIFEDIDAQGGIFVHWIAYNILPNVSILIENASRNSQAVLKGETNPTKVNFLQGLNESGETGYAGPCPIPGEEHRYFFRFYALDEVLELESGITKELLLKNIEGHIIAQTEFFGVYKR